MSRDYFNFNNKKDIKHIRFNQDIRKEDIADINMQKLFNIFDADKDGTLNVFNTNGINEANSLRNALTGNNGEQEVNLNLFKSGKYIAQKATTNILGFNKFNFEQNNIITVESFITNTLKLDLNSGDGKKIYERLTQLPQEELNKISADDFKDMKAPNFNEVANRLGFVDIRTSNEKNILLNRQHKQNEKLGVPEKEFASQMLSFIYENAALMLEQYYDNHGVLDAGTYLEGLNNILGWLTPDSIKGIDLRNTPQKIVDLKKQAEAFRNLPADKPETFKKEFKKLLGTEYNETNMKELMDLVNSGKIDLQSDKFNDACNKAFGFDGLKSTENNIKKRAGAGNIGDIVIMLMTLGAISETKLAVNGSSKLFSTFMKGASKVATPNVAQKIAKTGVSTIVSSANLGGFTLAKESLNNLTNKMRDPLTADTWKQTGILTTESAALGAFAGLFNAIVVQKVVNYTQANFATPLVEKGFNSVQKALIANKTMFGSDVINKFITAQVPSIGVQTVGFMTNVIGFTGYSIAEDIIKDIVDPKTGKLPEEMTVESLTRYLREKGAEQLKSLGTIHVISQLLMMIKGGNIGQKLASEALIKESPTLKNAKISKTNIDGNEVYQVKLKSGEQVYLKDVKDLMMYCNSLMQYDLMAKYCVGEFKNYIDPNVKNIVIENNGKNEVISTENIQKAIHEFNETGTVSKENLYKANLDIGKVFKADNNFTANKESAIALTNNNTSLASRTDMPASLNEITTPKKEYIKPQVVLKEVTVEDDFCTSDTSPKTENKINELIQRLVDFEVIKLDIRPDTIEYYKNIMTQTFQNCTDEIEAHPELFKKLSSRIISGIQKYNFSQDIKYLIEDTYNIITNPEITKESDLVIKLLDSKYPSGDSRFLLYLITAENINKYATQYKKYPELFDIALKTSERNLELKDLEMQASKIGNRIQDLEMMCQLTNFDGVQMVNLKDLILLTQQNHNVEKIKETLKILKEFLKTSTNTFTSSQIIKAIEANDQYKNLETCLKITNTYHKTADNLKSLAQTLCSLSNVDILEILLSPDLMKDIKKFSAGKYQTEMIEMLNPKYIDGISIENLLKSGLTKEEILKSIQKLSKSAFKLAYDTPNQYLSDIDEKYTTPINGKLPKLSENDLARQRKNVTDFFRKNLGVLIRVLNYLDNDTVSHLMDKRTNLFEESLNKLNQLTNDNLNLLSELTHLKSIKTGKPLSPREKIQIAEIVEIFQTCNMDTDIFKKYLDSGKIDIQDPKLVITKEILKRAGIDLESSNIDINQIKLNENYSYLALTNALEAILNSEELQSTLEEYKRSIIEMKNNPESVQSIIASIEENIENPKYKNILSQKNIQARKKYLQILRNINEHTVDEIYNIGKETIILALTQYAKNDELLKVINISILNNFKDYISDPSNEYGKTNNKTKIEFQKNGIDYGKWLKPEIPDVELTVAGKSMKIKMWDRNPQEDLFVGNKTTCCTAVGGANGSATPIYLLNTAFNVVELYDSNNNVVGMSRVFMSKIDNKPTLIMDNIELNKTYVKGMSDIEKSEIRDGFFTYMNEYAEQITNDPQSQVYFYSKDIHVPKKDLILENKVTDFIGHISEEMVYINSANCSWIEPEQLYEQGAISWLVVPKSNRRNLSHTQTKGNKNSTKSNRNSIELTENKPITKEECINILKTFNFTDAEIQKFPFNSDTQAYINSLSIMASINPDIIENIKSMEKAELIDDIMGYENFRQSGFAKYLNIENIAIFDKYIENIDLDNFNDYIVDFLTENQDNIDLYLNKLPLITELEGKISIQKFTDFSTMDLEIFKGINEDNVAFAKDINSVVSDEFKIHYNELSSIKDLTEEVKQKYISIAKSFEEKNLKPLTNSNEQDFNELINDMQKVNDYVENYSLDISIQSNDLQKTTQENISTINSSTLLNFAKSNNSKEIALAITTLNSETKQQGISLLAKDSSIPKTQIAEISNIIFDKAFGQIETPEKLFNFLETKYTTPDEFNEVIQYLKTLKDEPDFKRGYYQEFFIIPDNNYQNIQKINKLCREIEELGNDSPRKQIFMNYSANKANFDSQNIIEVLETMKKYSIRNHSKIMNDNLFYDKLGAKKIEFMQLLLEEKLIDKEELYNNWQYEQKVQSLYDEMNFLQDINTPEDKAFLENFVKSKRISRDAQQEIPVMNLNTKNYLQEIDNLKSIISLYKENPEIVTDIFNLKENNSNCIRFYQKEDIQNIKDAIELDSDFAHEILNLQYSSGSYKYKIGDGSLIKSIVEFAQEDKDFIREIAKSHYHQPEDFSNLLEAKKYNPELMDKLRNTTFITNYGQIQKGLSPNVIKDICMYSKQYPELIKEILQPSKEQNGQITFRLNEDDFSEILKNTVNEKLSIDIINRENFSQNIKALLECAKQDKNCVQSLINLKAKDVNGEDYYYLSSYDIQNIIALKDKTEKLDNELILNILDLTDITNKGKQVYELYPILSSNPDSAKEIFELNKTLPLKHTKIKDLIDISISDKNILKDMIILSSQLQDNSTKIYDKNMLWNNRYSRDLKSSIMLDIEPNIIRSRLQLAIKLQQDSKYTNNTIAQIIASMSNKTKDVIINDILNNENIPDKLKKEISCTINEENMNFARDFVLYNNQISNNAKAAIIKATNQYNKEIAQKYIINNPEIKEENKSLIIQGFHKNNIEFFDKIKETKEILENAKIPLELKVKLVIAMTSIKRIELIKQIFNDKTICDNPSKLNVALISIPKYEKIEDKNIIYKHLDFINKAFANKNLLKTGLDDLTDSMIQGIMSRENVIKALNILGASNLEAAFPMMIDNFEVFCNDVATMKISSDNLNSLFKIINPTNSKEYQNITEDINKLKSSLQTLLSESDRADINRLQPEITKLKTKISSLKATRKTMSQETNHKEDISKITEDINQLTITLKNTQKQIQQIYFNSSNSSEIKNLMNQINTKTKELNLITNNASKLSPQEIIRRTRVLSALSHTIKDSEMGELIDLIKDDSAQTNTQWNETINRKIFDKLGIEYDEKLSNKLKLNECKYLSEMFVSSEDFFINMRSLIEVIKNNPDLSIKEALETLPQNQETRKQFEALGINYDKFVTVDKNSFEKVNITLKEDEAKQGALNNLNEDFRLESFQQIPEQQRNDILNALKKEGITLGTIKEDVFVDDGMNAGQNNVQILMKNNQSITFEDMKKVIKTIKEVINKDEFWTTKNDNATIENAKNEIYEHMIKMRSAEIESAISLKGEEEVHIEIRKTNMYDIKQAIGLGNDGQCCTGLGKNFNEWSAPTYIKNKCIGAIELVDNEHFVGNTMFYIGIVDSKPALILDNIELKTKYQYNNQIRDSFLEYAKKLCTEIGQPELPIFAGPNRHKLNMNIYPKEEHTMEIAGSSGNDRVYIDYDAYSHKIGNGEKAHIEMYQLR